MSGFPSPPPPSSPSESLATPRGTLLWGGGCPHGLTPPPPPCPAATGTPRSGGWRDCPCMAGPRAPPGTPSPPTPRTRVSDGGCGGRWGLAPPGTGGVRGVGGLLHLLRAGEGAGVGGVEVGGCSLGVHMGAGTPLRVSPARRSARARFKLGTSSELGLQTGASCKLGPQTGTSSPPLPSSASAPVGTPPTPSPAPRGLSRGPPQWGDRGHPGQAGCSPPATPWGWVRHTHPPPPP